MLSHFHFETMISFLFVLLLRNPLFLLVKCFVTNWMTFVVKFLSAYNKITVIYKLLERKHKMVKM